MLSHLCAAIVLVVILYELAKWNKYESPSLIWIGSSILPRCADGITSHAKAFATEFCEKVQHSRVLDEFDTDFKAVGNWLFNEGITRVLLHMKMKDGKPTPWGFDFQCHIIRRRGFDWQGASLVNGSPWIIQDFIWQDVITIKFNAAEVWQGKRMENSEHFEIRCSRLALLDSFMATARTVRTGNAPTLRPHPLSVDLADTGHAVHGHVD